MVKEKRFESIFNKSEFAFRIYDNKNEKYFDNVYRDSKPTKKIVKALNTLEKYNISLIKFLDTNEGH